MIINHNLAANNAIRSANSNATTASKSMQKLSSGLRINSAADDAAGLAISEKMREVHLCLRKSPLCHPPRRCTPRCAASSSAHQAELERRWLAAWRTPDIPWH